MADELKKIPLIGPAGLYEANPDEAESLLGIGFEPAKPEDVEFYGPTQKAVGVLEAGARGLFGPLATAAEIALGAEPERIKKREEISVGKTLSTGIELGSLLIPGLAMTKAASLAAKGAQIPNYLSRLATASKFTLAGAGELAGSAAAAGIEGQVARLATKYGIENAVFGAADEVDKMLLSDEPQDALKNAQNVVTGAGLSFLIGAGVGASVGKVSDLWKATKGGKTARILEQAQKDADKAIPAEEILAQTGVPMTTTPPGPESIKSTQDLIDFVEGMPPVAEVPRETRKIVEEGMERLKSQNKLKYSPHEADLKALENKQYNDALQAFIERGDKPAAAQIQHLQNLKNTMVEGLSQEIKTISPNPVSDKLDAGRKFIDIVRTEYDSLWNKVTKKFDAFANVTTNKLEDVSELSRLVEQKFPGIMKFVEVTDNGLLSLKPYDSEMPILKLTHSALKDVVKQMNKKELTIQGLWNVHKNLANYLKRDIPKEAKQQITVLKKSVLDLLADNVTKIDPDVNVKNLFKEYSDVKKYIETIEDILGGKLIADSYLDSPIIPEQVLKNIFSNTTTVEAAKKLLGNKWNTVLADIIEVAKQSATDKSTGVFSSANFKKFLEVRSPQLKVGFEGQEQTLQNLIDFNTIMRTVPDKMPANPSRTAPTALELGKQLLGLGTLINPANAAEKVANLALMKIDEKMMRQGFDTLFKDKAAKPGLGMYRFLESAKQVSATGFEAMQEFIKQSAKGAYLTRNAIKNIFIDDKESPIKTPTERQLQSLDKRLQDMEQNLDEALNVSGELGYYLPEQDVALGVISARAIQYLASKRPGIKEGGLLNEPRLPTKAEQQKYFRTLQIAENPAIVLKRIKEGTLNSSDIKDLQALYPETYNQFLSNITEEIVNRKSENKPIPFRVRKSLSLFSGMPLDTTLSPQSIQAAQSVFVKNNVPPQGQLPQMAPKSSRKSQVPSMTETDSQRRMLNR